MRRFKLIVLLAVALFSGACQKYDACVPDENGGTDGKRAILWTQKQVERVATRAVAETDKLWEPGDTIRIKFQNGTPALQDEVKQYAAEWLTYANLVFLYVAPSEDADVKIGFDTDERWLAWSAIGTDCQSVPQDEVSLNFVWLEDEGAAGVKAEVLRGFGHVLGLGFEHKNPESNVQFKSNEWVAEEYNLSEADVEELITLYSTDQTNFTEYDKSSIMTITIPRSLVTKPIYATSRNSELSELDKEFVAGLYPVPVPIIKMVTGKQSVKLGIHKLQSIDVDWGDGVRETLVVSGYDGPEHIHEGNVPPVYNEVEHIYDSVGEYTIQIFATDSAITLLQCVENELTLLDLVTNRKLVYLDCGNNLISTLDVSKCIGLHWLSCGFNQLSFFDVSENFKLRTLNIPRNLLARLNLGNLPELESISAGECRLSSMDVSGLPSLYSLHVGENLISSLDLSHNPKLTHLMCYDNNLVSLDVSNNLEIFSIDCFRNPFLNNSAVLDFVNSLPDRTGLQPEGHLSMGSVYAEEEVMRICEAKKWK